MVRDRAHAERWRYGRCRHRPPCRRVAGLRNPCRPSIAGAQESCPGTIASEKLVKNQGLGEAMDSTGFRRESERLSHRGAKSDACGKHGLEPSASTISGDRCIRS